jgi:hypothetical protein
MVDGPLNDHEMLRYHSMASSSLLVIVLVFNLNLHNQQVETIEQLQESNAV